MADDYVKLDLAGDPEQAAELRRLHRQQIIADMLMKQSMNAPQGQMIGKVYVAPNPMQGIAQLGQAFMANRANQGIDQGYDALGQSNKVKTAEAIQKYQQGMAGTPERPAMQDPQELQQQADQGTPAPLNIPAQPATQEQKLAAVRDAILGNNPRLNKMGQFDLTQMNAEQARKESAQNKLEQLKAQADAKAEAQLKHEELLKSMQAAALAAKPAEPLVQILGKDNKPVWASRTQAIGQPVYEKPNGSPHADKEAYKIGLKEIQADDKLVAEASALEPKLARWKELNPKVETGPVAGRRPISFNNDFQELKQLESDSAMNNFKPGQGQISNFERGLIKGGNTSTLNDVVTNNRIADIKLGAIQNIKDRANFRQVYLERKGNLLGSEKAWQDYLDKNPRYTSDKAGNIIPNESRIPWTQAFGVGSNDTGGSPAAPPSTGLSPAEQAELDSLRKRFNK